MAFVNPTKFRAARATSPPVSLEASPYPRQDITTLRSNIKCLTTDYHLLKTSFIDRASPKHLRKNIAAFEKAILEAFGDAGDETAQPGFVLMKLTSKAFKLFIKMQAGEATEAKKVEIEEEFTELSNEYEKYRAAFETLRCQLEKSNRGPRAFYLYGVGVNYEVIGNQNFDPSMVSTMSTLEHGKEMDTANRGKKRGAEEDNGEHTPPAKRARGRIPKQVVEIVEVEEEEEEEEAARPEPAKRARRARVTAVAKLKAPTSSMSQSVSNNQRKAKAKAQVQAKEDESEKIKESEGEKEGANEGESGADAELVVVEEKAAGPRRSARVPKANKKYM
ncbi:unnamed protein product [Sphagnum balticum]